MRVVRTRHGVRLEEGGCVLSEVRSSPGPTHSLFDVLAGCIAAFASGPRVAMLGFAAGGVIPPLRAMGCWHAIQGVDLCTEAESIFRELCGQWCGEVNVTEGDALAWLRRQRKPFDLILEDLSANIDSDLTKPPVSINSLPSAMSQAIGALGVVVTNVLPVPGMPWTTLLRGLAKPFARARYLELEQWENRVLICGEALPSAREVGRLLRAELHVISSQEEHGIAVRTLKG